MQNFTTIILFMISSVGLFAQADWRATSAPLTTDQADNGFGHALALSADGTSLIVGAPFHEQNGNRPGAVYVYQATANGSSWQQVGSTLTGTADSDRMGYSVAINAAGTVIAAGLPSFDNPTVEVGKVRVFELQNGGWQQRGADLETSGGFEFGWDLALSGTGDRVAITSIAGGADVVYEWDGSSWLLLGAPFSESGDFNPFSTALSANGQRVAFGSPNLSGLVDDFGAVYVYEWSDGTWMQLGDPMVDDLKFRDYGVAIDLNETGNTVVIGAPQQRDDNNSQRGGVEVYEYAANAGWTQKGSTLYGTNTNDEFGAQVAINNDGTILLVGAPNADGNGSSNNGSGTAFEWDGTDWQPRGAVLRGTDFGANAGTTLALDDSASRVALTLESGTVQVFDWTIISSTAEALDFKWQLFPNPASDVLTVTVETPTEPVRVQLFSASGKLVREQGPSYQGVTRLAVDDLSGSHYLILRSGTRVGVQQVIIKK